MLISYIRKIIDILPKNSKNKILMLSFIATIAGFLEFFGIALVFPLILIILTPELVSDIPYIGVYLKNFVGQKYVLLFSVFIIMVFILKNLFMILSNYIQANVLKQCQNEINLEIIKAYLFCLYEHNLTIPSKYSLINAFQTVLLFFSGVLHRALVFTSNFIIFVVILAFLIWKYNVWVLCAGIFFIFSGLVQSNFFKTKGKKLATQKIEIMQKINNNILLALKNIKDIKIFAKEKYFYEKYKNDSKKFVFIDTLFSFFESLPQNIVEICIIFCILIMSYGIFVISDGNSQLIVANLGMLVAAMFRMAPLINKMQLHFNLINANLPITNEFINVYSFYKNLEVNLDVTNEKLNLKNSIVTKNLSFSYGEKNILSEQNLEIKKGEFVGIIGHSGVGKTTFMDILMGFLSLKEGEILIDGVLLDKTKIKKWLNSVGYVPQDITILPVTVAQNIAFGCDKDFIDYKQIDEVVKITQLEDYINSLEKGVHTELTDMQNMSQGQKQRIGIARALYKSPEVLFFDEITSALDLETESKIISSLEHLKGSKTIIAIAHRLSTLKNCDRIFYFKSSKEIVCGTIDELLEKDESFRALVKLASFK